jgi:hypothetical protein
MQVQIFENILWCRSRQRNIRKDVKAPNHCNGNISIHMYRIYSIFITGILHYKIGSRVASTTPTHIYYYSCCVHHIYTHLLLLVLRPPHLHTFVITRVASTTSTVHTFIITRVASTTSMYTHLLLLVLRPPHLHTFIITRVVSTTYTHNYYYKNFGDSQIILRHLCRWDMLLWDIPLQSS